MLDHLPLRVRAIDAAGRRIPAGDTAVTRWENGNVWGADFRDDGGDVAPLGGSELPEIYF